MMFGSRTHKTIWQCGHNKCQDEIWVFRYFVNRNLGFSNSNVQLPPLDCNGYVIGLRTQSDRTADTIWSDGGRNLIGWRTQSDWVANGIRLGGGCLQGGALVSSAPTKQYWHSSYFVGAVLACLVGALETSAPPKENAEEQNRVGGKRSSFLPTFVFRPLTPPYVRFRIRRFLFWIPFEICLH